MSKRIAKVNRKTSETDIAIEVDLDTPGDITVNTGLGFFDHMLTALAKHGRFSLSLRCQGDLEVDDHHTIEDCALALGEAISESLKDRSGIWRFGSAYAPLDESLARVVIDLGGRPSSSVNLELVRDTIGDVTSENLSHFFSSLAVTLRAAIHVDIIRGENDHHKAEAAFKALALALRAAVTHDGTDNVPSTKGIL